MRIIIVGAGQVDFYICERFSNKAQDIVLIDTDQKKLQRIQRDLNIMTVHGSGASARILAEAMILDKKSLDIDLTISPDLAMTDEIVSLCHISAAFEMAKFADGRLILLGYAIREDNPRVGMTLFKLQQAHGSHHFIMAAIIRGKDTIIPRGDDSIQAGNKIYIMVRREDILRVEKFFRLNSPAPHKVLIIGGGRIGSAVIATLGNVGPGLILVGPTQNFSILTPLAKVVLIICMLAGRLELYTIVVLLTPAFWRMARRPSLRPFSLFNNGSKAGSLSNTPPPRTP